MSIAGARGYQCDKLSLLSHNLEKSIQNDKTSNYLMTLFNLKMCSWLFLLCILQYYEVGKKCDGSLCYDFGKVESYLNQGSVRDALGVGDRKFVSSSTAVYEAMVTDWM